jgi:hypothetical protein
MSDTPTVPSTPAPKSAKPICSNSFFREYIQKHSRYPDQVVWNKQLSAFSFEECVFKKANVLECFKRKGINNIVVYGDSQGYRFSTFLFKVLGNRGLKCKVTEREKSGADGHPDLSYIARGDLSLKARLVETGVHHCSSCRGHRGKCTARNMTVQMEYIPSEVMETKYIALNATNSSAATDNVQEMLFEVYFKNRFPDLHLEFVQMNHLKFGLDLPEFREQLQRHLALVKKTKPPKVYFGIFPGMSEFESKRKDARYKNKKVNGLLATPLIEIFNHFMFQYLKTDLLNSTSKYFSFPDLVKVTSALMKFSVDGVHFQPQVYEILLNSFIDVFCAD